mgnify:CR=1 FL=1
MKAIDLIGKKALRTAPTSITNDRSYMSTPLKIVDATNYHIFFEYADKWHRTYMDTNIHILDSDFCDDNWIECKINL